LLTVDSSILEEKTMRIALVATVVCLALIAVGCEAFDALDRGFSRLDRAITGGGAPNPALTPDAYGPGIHANENGQPVTVRPDFGGVPGERLELQPDAYGPGIHSDQYGRPVREYSWPDGRPVP
jgi:hypothetical protein